MRHDIKNTSIRQKHAMTSKSALWRKKVRHDVRNTSWRQKLHHDVKNMSWRQKVRHEFINTSWRHKFLHIVKNTPWRKKVRRSRQRPCLPKSQKKCNVLCVYLTHQTIIFVILIIPVICFVYVVQILIMSCNSACAIVFVIFYIQDSNVMLHFVCYVTSHVWCVFI